jgi:hypothetical protein
LHQNHKLGINIERLGSGYKFSRNDYGALLNSNATISAFMDPSYRCSQIGVYYGYQFLKIKNHRFSLNINPQVSFFSYNGIGSGASGSSNGDTIKFDLLGSFNDSLFNNKITFWPKAFIEDEIDLKKYVLTIGCSYEESMVALPKLYSDILITINSNPTQRFLQNVTLKPKAISVYVKIGRKINLNWLEFLMQ